MELAAEIFASVADLAARVQPLGLALGAPLCLAGLALLTVGTRQRRVLAGVGLAAVGALAAVLLRGPIRAHLGLGPGVSAAAFAAVGAIGGAFAPAALPFGLAALPGALAGSQLPLGGRAEIGAAAGALAAGIVGLLLARLLTATAAGLGGGLALALGLLGCFRGDPLARELAARPAVVLGFALVAGIAGAALQLSGAGAATSPAGPAARSPGSPP